MRGRGGFGGMPGMPGMPSPLDRDPATRSQTRRLRNPGGDVSGGKDDDGKQPDAGADAGSTSTEGAARPPAGAAGQGGGQGQVVPSDHKPMTPSEGKGVPTGGGDGDKSGGGSGAGAGSGGSHVTEIVTLGASAGAALGGLAGITGGPGWVIVGVLGGGILGGVGVHRVVTGHWFWGGRPADDGSGGDGPGGPRSLGLMQPVYGAGSSGASVFMPADDGTGPAGPWLHSASYSSGESMFMPADDGAGPVGPSLRNAAPTRPVTSLYMPNPDDPGPGTPTSRSAVAAAVGLQTAMAAILRSGW